MYWLLDWLLAYNHFFKYKYDRTDNLKTVSNVLNNDK